MGDFIAEMVVLYIASDCLLLNYVEWPITRNPSFRNRIKGKEAFGQWVPTAEWSW